MALRSEARVFSASTRSLPARSASARSLAFSRSAASIAARSVEVEGVGAAATLWREHALLKAANASKEIVSMVFLRMSPVSVKIHHQDDYDRELATRGFNRNFMPGSVPLGLMSCRRQLGALLSW